MKILFLIRKAKLGGLLAGSLVMAVTSFANNWNESVQGDLSDDRLAPTLFALDPGFNTLSGTVIGGGAPDRDYVTFTVLDGYILQALTLDDYSAASGLSFIGIQSGSTFTQPPTGTDVAELLGYAHFGPGEEGMNLLPAMGEGDGAMGFPPPLSAGTYTLWIQETGGASRGYSFVFDMVADPVPEPKTLVLIIVGLAVVAGSLLRSFLRSRGR